MKNLVLIASLFLFSQTSFATETFSCDFADILDVSSFQIGDNEMKDRRLSKTEKDFIESAFYDEFDCDHLVLLGGVVTTEGADYLALCHADGMGPNQVRLPLTCY